MKKWRFAVLVVAAFPIVALAVDVATVTLRGGDWHVIEWEFEGSGSGADTALTDKPVYGQVVQSYWLPSDNPAVAAGSTTPSITAKSYYGGQADTTDLMWGRLTYPVTATPTLRTRSYWPTSVAPSPTTPSMVAGYVYLELSNGLNAERQGGGGTLQLVVAPTLDQGDNP